MSVESIMLGLRKTKSGRIVLHFLLWLIYFSAICYLDSISFNGYKGNAAILAPIKNIATTMIAYYPLVYFVWPFYLSKKKYFKGLLLVAMLIILYSTADHLLDRVILQSCKACMENMKSKSNGYYQLYQRGAIHVIIVQLITFGVVYQLFVFLAFPLAIKALIEYFNQRVTTIRLQQENILLEFNFLKSQVNPHFLFNTLNNIYALILKGEQEASAETVTKLASFMRYSLYESNSDRNNIVKEIDLLKVYIELERIRLNETVVNFISNIDACTYSIPPLLFMPAVENAFKYCTATSEGDAYIFLKLEIERSELVFVISNTYQRGQPEPALHGGIGLQNLQKRLKHYYPDKNSSMEIEQTPTVFQITIHLNLV